MDKKGVNTSNLGDSAYEQVVLALSDVNGLCTCSSGGLSSGELAAAIVVPLVGCVVIAFAVWFLAGRQRSFLISDHVTHLVRKSAEAVRAGGQWLDDQVQNAKASKAPGIGMDTTIVLTDVQNSTTLFEVLPTDVMDKCMRLHDDCFRRLLVKHQGYESATEGDAFIMSFHNPLSALQFCLEVQIELMAVEWPRQLSTVPDGRCVFVGLRSSNTPSDICKPNIQRGMTSVPHASAWDGGLNVTKSSNSVYPSSRMSCPGSPLEGPQVASRFMAHGINRPDSGCHSIRESLDLRPGPLCEGVESQEEHGPPLPPFPLVDRHGSLEESEGAQNSSCPQLLTADISRPLTKKKKQEINKPAIGHVKELVEMGSLITPRRNSSEDSEVMSMTSRLKRFFPHSVHHPIQSMNRSLVLETESNSPEPKVAGQESCTEEETEDFEGVNSSNIACSTWQQQVAAQYPKVREGSENKKLIFSGLRVRMGMHCGVLNDTEISLDPSSNHTSYSGLPLDIARAVCDAAPGGAVMMSSEAFARTVQLQQHRPKAGSQFDIESGLVTGNRRLSLDIPASPLVDKDKALDNAIVVYAGDHKMQKLDECHEQLALYLAVPESLTARMVYLPPIRYTKPCSLSTLAAPVGTVTIVFLSVVGASGLLTNLPGPAKEAFKIFQMLIMQTVATSLLYKHGGYAKELAEGLVLAAFFHPSNAICWALEVIEEMPKLDWPSAILADPLGMEEEMVMKPPRGDQVHIWDEDEHEMEPYVKELPDSHCTGAPSMEELMLIDGRGSPATRTTFLRGLRVKAGIDMGVVAANVVTATGLLHYRGKVMNRSSRVGSMASAGLVLCTSLAWRYALEHKSTADASICADTLGEFEMKGVAGPMVLMDCYVDAIKAKERRKMVRRSSESKSIKAVPPVNSSHSESRGGDRHHSMPLHHVRQESRPPEMKTLIEQGLLNQIAQASSTQKNCKSQQLPKPLAQQHLGSPSEDLLWLVTPTLLSTGSPFKLQNESSTSLNHHTNGGEVQELKGRTSSPCTTSHRKAISSSQQKIHGRAYQLPNLLNSGIQYPRGPVSSSLQSFRPNSTPNYFHKAPVAHTVGGSPGSSWTRDERPMTTELPVRSSTQGEASLYGMALLQHYKAVQVGPLRGVGSPFQSMSAPWPSSEMAHHASLGPQCSETSEFSAGGLNRDSANSQTSQNVRSPIPYSRQPSRLASGVTVSSALHPSGQLHNSTSNVLPCGLSVGGEDLILPQTGVLHTDNRSSGDHNTWQARDI